jgi:hypothetical protein
MDKADFEGLKSSVQQMAGMIQMETLLRRWAELEPERVMFSDDIQYARVLIGEYWACLSHWSRWPNAIDHPWHIQIAVQEAIERRGWGWEIVYDQIQRLYQATLCDDRSKWLGSSEWDDTPAAALLTAYLSAIEALTP